MSGQSQYRNLKASIDRKRRYNRLLARELAPLSYDNLDPGLGKSVFYWVFTGSGCTWHRRPVLMYKFLIVLSCSRYGRTIVDLLDYKYLKKSICRVRLLSSRLLKQFMDWASTSSCARFCINFDFILYYNLLLCFIPLEMHVRLIRAIKFYLLTYLLISSIEIDNPSGKEVQTWITATMLLRQFPSGLDLAEVSSAFLKKMWPRTRSGWQSHDHFK